jgi:hypothetical protein
MPLNTKHSLLEARLPSPRTPKSAGRALARIHASGRANLPASRSVAPVPHQLFIICRARFRRSFDELPRPTSLAR